MKIWTTPWHRFSELAALVCDYQPVARILVEQLTPQLEHVASARDIARVIAEVALAGNQAIAMKQPAVHLCAEPSFGDRGSSS